MSILDFYPNVNLSIVFYYVEINTFPIKVLMYFLNYNGALIFPGATKKNTFYLPVSAVNPTVKRTGTGLLLNYKTQCKCPTDIGHA